MADFIAKGLIFIICVAFAHLGVCSIAEPLNEKKVLLDFLSKLDYNNERLNWDPSNHVCNWTGIRCDKPGHVCIIRLPGVGLTGQIPPNTIGQLTHLRVLSFRNNKLFGSIPSDFGSLLGLTHLFFQSNRFSGSFPLSLTTLPKLGRLDLSRNQFEGRIPALISNLMLRTLLLQNNKFSGEIPSNINTAILLAFDVSNNNLSGEIPKTLSKYPDVSFYGNPFLCGSPLATCKNESSSPPQSKKRGSTRLPTHVIAIINVICVVAALFFISFLIYCMIKRCARNRRGMPQSPLHSNSGGDFGHDSSSKEHNTSTCELTKNNRLIFFEPGKYGFDLQSLLGASAEVLGKGSTGTSYKAEMDDGTTVAVKRLKEVVVGKKEFDTHMSLLGQLRHENVVKLIAYYYCKDEKLVISDFIHSGSLSSLLHASRGSGRPPLCWITRFKIGLTAARGLHHIHATAKLPHGNIKSSNILVTKSLEACVSDYGMHLLFGPSTPIRAAGYKAPEVAQQEKMVSFKSDVYSFGIVLLEMLTGKSPNQVVAVGDDGVDLPRWVKSVMAEEFEAEVFDEELLGNGAEEEMVAVLQIAMKCVEVVVESRPDMWEVLRMLEMVESGEYLSPVPLSTNGKRE